MIFQVCLVDLGVSSPPYMISISDGLPTLCYIGELAKNYWLL